MQTFPITLAHGALGPYDEIIFLGVAVAFIAMMAVSWIKSRNETPEFEEDHPEVERDPAQPDDNTSNDHVRLV